MTAAEIELAVQLVELAAKLGVSLYEAIAAHGELSAEQKAALVARVKAARAAATAYAPRDV